MTRSSARAVSIVVAVGTTAVVLSPAFDRRADASFVWHMAQHLMLLFVVPFFVLCTDPFALVTRLGGKRSVIAILRATQPLRVFASPPFALAVFIAVLWGTHFSPLYEASLEHPWIHMLEHGMFFSAGVVFWLPVLAPHPVRPAAYPVRLLYLLLALPQGALLGIALMNSRTPLYAHYVAQSSAAQALAQQDAAAALMWICGGLIVFSAFIATFGRWARRERRALGHAVRMESGS